MSSALDLAEFLLARISEDEEARRNLHSPSGRGGLSWDFYTRRWTSKERVFADCKAKRAIVESAAAWARGAGYQPAKDAMEVTLRRLATVYTDHPDYREEWRP